MAIIMSVVIILPCVSTLAAEIINPNPKVDIIVNTCSDYSGTYEEFKQALAAELEKNYNTNGAEINISDVRISEAGIKIDTVDLTDWHVYDHYGATGNPLSNSKPSTWNDYSGRKPYYYYQTPNSYVAVANIQTSLGKIDVTGLSDDNAKNYLFTIPQIFNSGLINYISGNVGSLDSHIYSSVDQYGKASMTFVGYPTSGYKDFLFYPVTTRSKKSISFDIDAQNVKVHSLDGAGFLVNAGIDKNGKLQGYILYFKFNSTVTGGDVYIYRLDGTKTPTEIHNNASTGLGSCGVVQVATQAFTLNTTSKKSKIFVDFTTDRITVQKQDYTDLSGTLGSITSLFSNTSIDTAQFPYTNYNGFGPFVAYASHSCSTTSYFIYSDLVMSYQTDTFEAIRNSQFAQDRSETDTVNRFLINLADSNPELPESAAEYNEGILRLINDKVQYISTADDSKNGMNSFGSMADSLGSENVFYTSVSDAEYIAKIAKYIADSNGWSTKDVNPPALTAPAAKFTIIGKDADDTQATYQQIISIHRQHLINEGKNQRVEVTFKDASTPVNESTPIVKWEYVIRDQNEKVISEKVVNFGDTDATPPSITIDSNSIIGRYTLTLTVTDSNGVASNSSTLPFDVVDDNVAPTIGIQSDSKNYGKVNVTISDSLSGVQAYQIGEFGPKVTLTTVRPEATISVNIPQDGSSLVITAWDECGNSKTQTYTTKKVTYYTNLSDITTVYNTQYVLTGTEISVLPVSPVDANGDKYFVGWYNTSGSTGGTAITATTKVSSDTIVYARWNSSRYLLSFNANGGSFIGSAPSFNVAEGTLLTTAVKNVEIPTRAGYDFVEWCTNTGGTALGTITMTTNTTVFAKWTLGNVTLTLDPNGGVKGGTDKLQGLNGSLISTILTNYGTGNTTPTKNGWSFVTWKMKESNGNLRAITSSDKLGDNGAIVYAEWIRDNMQFTGSTLPTTKYATNYSTTIGATNGTKKYKYSLAEGTTLPAGLILNVDTGLISGTVTADIKTYTFKITATEQPNASVSLAECKSITQSFTLVVGQGDKPTITDKNVNIKADATDKELALTTGLVQVPVGVSNISWAKTGITATGGEYIGTITYDSKVGGGTGTVKVKYTDIYPTLTVNVASINDIDATDDENANETSLLAYVNSSEYRALSLTGDNTAYSSALGTAPTNWTLPEYTFSNEASTPKKSYKPAGDDYVFTQTYLNNTITRNLLVNPIGVEFDGTETYYVFADDNSFVLDMVSTNEGSTVTFELANESKDSGIISVDLGGTVTIQNSGTAKVIATGSETDHYCESSKVITVVVSTRPTVMTGSASTSITDMSATLNGSIIKGTENTVDNGYIESGFMYKKATDVDYTKVIVDITDHNAISKFIDGLETNVVYEYYAFATTRSGITTGSVEEFEITQNTSVITLDSNNVTYESASLSGKVQSGNILEKGFEYRVKGQLTFIKEKVSLSSNTNTTITNLYPNTEYEFRAYANTSEGMVYGEILGFTTESYNPSSQSGLKIGDLETGNTPLSDNGDGNSYHMIIPPDSDGISVDGTIENPTYNNISYLEPIIPGEEDDPKNNITIDENGNIIIGENVNQADIAFYVDGVEYTIHVLRGSLSVGTANNAQVAIASINQQYLRNSINEQNMYGLVSAGQHVEIRLVSSDFSGSLSTVDAFTQYATSNIHNKVKMDLMDLSLYQIIDGNVDGATEINHLERPIKVDLELTDDWENVRDIRVLHERHDGTIELIAVNRSGRNISMYVQDFSSYAIVGVNQYGVNVNIEGEGQVLPGNDNYVLDGESITLDFSPARLYYLESVTDNGIPVTLDNYTYTITDVSEDHNINVIFKHNQFGIQASAGANGKISPSGLTNVDEEGNITYRFTPNDGYRVSAIIVDGVEFATNSVEYTFTNVTSEHTIQVIFEEIPVEPVTPVDQTDSTDPTNPTDSTNVTDSTNSSAGGGLKGIETKTNDVFNEILNILMIVIALSGLIIVLSMKSVYNKDITTMYECIDNKNVITMFKEYGFENMNGLWNHIRKKMEFVEKEISRCAECIKVTLLYELMALFKNVSKGSMRLSSNSVIYMKVNPMEYSFI